MDLQDKLKCRFTFPFCLISVHAAIIAINDAVDHQEAEGTLKALQNSNAHLVNIQAPTFQDYQDMLYMAKYTKAENARNKSMDPDSSYVPDVYDEMLTQAEIQGNVNTVNGRDLE